MKVLLATFSTFGLPNKATETSLYTKVKWKPNRKIIIEPGIRLNTFTSMTNLYIQIFDWVLNI
ncbi:MAG: hypothetical protein Ct9H300mP18_10100 [Candidatus Neomarinimicrobiota bacterium]|nr:MAG: hypothetical protein Ct9H300mP18_10100 [Candidatus Neomarinimicrobiota bacterium]